MLFPNPMSSRVLVRKTQAAIIGEVGHIFEGEIEALLAEEKHACLEVDPRIEATIVEQKKQRIMNIGRRVIAVAVRFFWENIILVIELTEGK